MFSCPRCGARFDAGSVPSALTCPRCREKDKVFAPLTFWLFDPPGGGGKRPAATEPGEGRRLR